MKLTATTATLPPTDGIQRFLALDLGTKTGWARVEPGLIVAGEEDFAPGRYESSGMRLLKFQAWLRETALVGIGAVVFEEVAFTRYKQAAEVLHGLLAVLQVQCIHAEVPCTGVPVGTLKKWATGKGNAPKGKMVDAALQRMHGGSDVSIVAPDPPSDNTADAILLAEYARTEMHW